MERVHLSLSDSHGLCGQRPSLMHARLCAGELSSWKARIIQELVPGKQVTIAHLIAHPDEDLAKKMGVPGAEAVGILTLSPREAAMIAGDFATKAASVQIGFVDRFTGALVIQGSVASVEEALRYTVKALHDVLGFAACETTKS